MYKEIMLFLQHEYSLVSSKPLGCVCVYGSLLFKSFPFYINLFSLASHFSFKELVNVSLRLANRLEIESPFKLINATDGVLMA